MWHVIRKNPRQALLLRRFMGIFLAILKKVLTFSFICGKII